MATKSRLKIKTIGLDELKRAMDKFGDAVIQAVDEAIHETAETTKDMAIAKAPEETGALKRGIIVRRFNTRKNTLAVWDVGMDPAMNDVFQKPIKNPKGKRKTAYYPASIEYGTPHAKAKPFLRTAMKANRNRAKIAVTTKVRAVIDRAY